MLSHVYIIICENILNFYNYKSTQGYAIINTEFKMRTATAKCSF